MWGMLRPTVLQIELTYSCNNACEFCYNKRSGVFSGGDLISFDRLKDIVYDIYQYGIFSINFNGGEPFCFDSFLELAAYSKSLGLDIHCNSNATLINESNIVAFSDIFGSMCTSIHGPNRETHDRIVGRDGAFDETLTAISLLQANDVYVAVNVTLSRENIESFFEILVMLQRINIRTVLLTRVLTIDRRFAISDSEMINAISVIKEFQYKTNAFVRIAFPQPFPICYCSDFKVSEYIKEHNIPCTAGILTARITPFGVVTPCPLLETPIIGNLHNELFSSVWERFQKMQWHKELQVSGNCNTCRSLSCCGGGCLRQSKSGILFS